MPTRRFPWLVLSCILALTGVVVAAGAGTSSASTQFPIDHQQCYTAAAISSTAITGPNFPATPAAVQLTDAFNNVFASIGKVSMLCNPAQKTLPTGLVTPITNPNAHLVCWSIKPNQPVLPGVTLTNQFGSGFLQATALKNLCLPSWKSLTSAANFPSSPTTPPNLDHYDCYSSTHPAGTVNFKRPAFVQITDEFGSFTAKVGAPSSMCFPVKKFINPTVAPTPVLFPRVGYVCFTLSPGTTVTLPTVAYAENQFGIGAVGPQKLGPLCVPSSF
jgi:hypothetical protein